MPLTKVTSGVIAANAVVDSFGTQSITGDKIGLNAITGNTLASNIINANNIVNATITGSKIVLGTLTGNLIAANTITGDDLGQNSVSANNIAISAIENYTNLTGRPLSNRNLIFNGAMQIAQRNTSVTGITTNDSILTADRWKITSGSLGTWTMNVESSGPTSTGLRKSANLICTSAQTSPPSGSYLLFKQDMEGQMLQSIKKGTPGAEQVTVSFWVRSSNTGTYITEMRDNDNNRACSRSYTIDTANTWERKTITFPADTTGQLDNDNERSMELSFWFGSGSDYAGGTLQTTWGTTVGADNTRAAGQLNLANRVGNYIAFTGIQWEIGPVATPFEFEDFGTTLRKCQRYYLRDTVDLNNTTFLTGIGNGVNNAGIRCSRPFPVSMRAVPTVSFNTLRAYDGSNVYTVSSVLTQYSSRNIGHADFALSGTPSAGRVLQIIELTTSSYVDYAAEL